MRELLEKYDVTILGAGAAGLFCAAIAGARGRRVLVLESANKVGKKILMSGGGRCNFTNLQVEADNFISKNPHFCKSALSRYTQWEFIALVERHGIDYEERKHGQLFCEHSAAEILGMLTAECEKAGVTIATHCSINSVDSLESSAGGDANTGEIVPVQGLPDRYRIVFSQGSKGEETKESVDCQSLVVATGALSIPTLGGSGLGYDMAKKFSLPLTRRRAGLVPFMFSDDMKPICARLSGVSMEVEATCNGHSFTENLLFTHRGISGPVILQVSNYWYPGDAVFINLLPAVDCREWLLDSKKLQGNGFLRSLLSQQLPRALVAELQTLWWADKAEWRLTEFSDKHLLEIADRLQHWSLRPSSTEGYRTAEVTLGGVDTAAISSRTMEASAQPGLYFIGEVLDVSGHLGGYNFQWAWSSAYSAAQFV